MHARTDALHGFEDANDMPGTLHWEVGYFGKPSFRPALRTDGKNKDLPPALKDKPELQVSKMGSIATCRL